MKNLKIIRRNKQPIIDNYGSIIVDILTFFIFDIISIFENKNTMQTFIMQSNNSIDLALLLSLAKRLSINYYETDNSIFNTEVPDTNTLYEDEKTELKQESEFMNFDDFSKDFNNSNLEDYNTASLFTTPQEIGESWDEYEEDEDEYEEDEETLEELLNRLKL